MQILLVDTSEGTEIRPERRARSFATIAVDLTSAITIVIPGPFTGTVAHGGMGGVAPMIALPLVRIEPRTVGQNVLGYQLVAGMRVRVLTHPEALLTCLPRDHADNGGTIVRVGAVPPALIGASAGGISGIAMGRAFFPPRSDRVHPPQRRFRSSHRSGRSRSGGPESAAAGYGAVCAISPTHARAVPWAPLWQSHAVPAPRSLAAAGFSRRPSWLTTCNTLRRSGSDRPENALVLGRRAEMGCHSEGR
jgi:hypothetical protein